MPEPFERLGAAIRAARRKRGWSQKTLAEHLVAASPGVGSLHQVTVSAWERGVHLPSVEFRPALRRLLGREVAGLIDAAERVADERADQQCVPCAEPQHDYLTPSDGHASTATVNLCEVQAEPALDQEGRTKRRQMLRGLGTGVGAVLAALLEPIVGSEAVALLAAEPGRIGSAHLDVVGAAARGLERLDAEQGGDFTYGLTTQLIARVDGWLADGSHPSHLGDRLRQAAGDLHAWAGWFALDAGRQTAARYHFHEALLIARILGDRPLEVRTMAQMVLQSKALGRRREAVDLAKTAQRVATGWATPRLTTLLHLRAAGAYTDLPDSSAFRRELASAQHFFEEGPREDDPLFTDFLTPAELIGLEGLAYKDLGDLGKAADLHRESIHRTGPDRPRNRAYYSTSLAGVLLLQGDTTGASEVGIEIVPLVSTLQSGRTGKHLASLRTGLEEHSKEPKAREFIECYDHFIAGRRGLHGR